MILAPTLSLSAGSGAAIVRPTFSRDFAGEKSLNNGTGPAITFTRGSQATYFDANGTLQTASNDVPRFDHDPATGASRGLLIEEARTNSIRNSQAGGAVAGTPGTAPTNWPTSGSTGGLTRTIATGTINGFNYLDFRFEGTPTSTFQIVLDAEALGQVAASSGQVWTSSVYMALIAGTPPDCIVGISERLADLTLLTGSTTNVVSSLTSSLQRFSHTRTLTDATTARVSAAFRVTVTNGVPLDFTLRIAAPQLEQGAFPTSYIPTTTAAATRSADSAVVTPISSFYNQSEGTLFAEAREGGSDVLYGAASVDTDTSDNRIDIRRSNDASSIGFFVSTGAASQAQLFRTLSASAQTYKAVVAYATNDIAAALNGGAVTSDTSATLPTLTHLRIGGLAATAPSTGNAFHINGHIRRIAYYPKRLSNALLQSLTA